MVPAVELASDKSRVYDCDKALDHNNKTIVFVHTTYS